MWLVQIARDSEIEKGLKVAEKLREKEKEKVGEKEQEKGQQVVPESWKAKVEAWEVDSNMSEILFPGHLIQVGEVVSPLEPEKIDSYIGCMGISRWWRLGPGSLWVSGRRGCTWGNGLIFGMVSLQRWRGGAV